MYQPPDPQYPSNQQWHPGFHNDQTQAFPQQPPLPPYPGHFGQPPIPPPPPRKKRGRGCLIASIITIIVLACAIFATGFHDLDKPTTADSAITPTAQQEATDVLSSSSPTVIPTSTPIPPQPTLEPTSTPIPPQPTLIPTSMPKTTGINGNPWGYDHNAPGDLISSPPAGFCGYFACISSFWDGKGYVVQCNDGMYSKSGGNSGICSRHGGAMRPLYAH